MKKLLLLALSVATLFLASPNAIAASFTLGDGTLGPGDTGLFGAAPKAGTISDTFDFVTTSAAEIGALAASIEIFRREISGLSVELYRGNPTDGSANDTLVSGSVPLIPSGDLVVLAFSNLQAGLQYYFLVGGVAGPKGGIYLGLYHLSAVPLPAAVWLLGTALTVLVGFAGSRRRTA